jgi:hypothetical protein
MNHIVFRVIHETQFIFYYYPNKSYMKIEIIYIEEEFNY